MKHTELSLLQHNTKIGDRCPYIEPNVVDDSMFYVDGKPIGFYLKTMPEKMCALADIANHELRSDRVPKQLLERSDVMAKVYQEGMSRKQAKRTGVVQMSAILGSIPPKPHMKRPYASRSSLHAVKTAKPFVKAMLMLAYESERLVQQMLPEQYELQRNLFNGVQDKWKFGNIFTSSISNYNISAPFHRDIGNIVGAVNVIICKRWNSKGGDLHVPDYGVTVGQEDNSVLVYPAWKNVHGVTPIVPSFEGGYRNSLIFYPLKAFVGLQ
jgi:hypothetical protein